MRQGTPLHYVSAVAFSPSSGYITIGNDRGKALLYRLKHYQAS
jgi:U3 small nucleolar RNA-associated protein 18